MTATIARVGDADLTPGSEPDRERSHGMDGIREFLEAVRDAGLATGHVRGLFHVAIGRRVSKTDGTVLSTGVTWRELAVWLKNLRFDKDLVAELGADPDTLSPRDRQRMWYSAIGLAKVDGAEAFAQAAKLTALVRPLGFVIGPPPTAAPVESPPEKPAPPKPDDDAGKAKKKKR